MRHRLFRLFVSLLLPPVIAATAMLWINEDHVTPSWSELPVVILITSIFTMFPSLLFWGIFELLWTACREWVERFWLNCLLGMITGIVVTPVIHTVLFLVSGRFDAKGILSLLPLGLIVGLVTSAACWLATRSSLRHD